MAFRGAIAGAFLLLALAPRGAGAELLELVTDAVNAPIYLTHAGDARLFVAERAGRVRIVEDGALRPEPFLDLSERVDGRGEGGLLSIAFHPDYAVNGAFYASYTTDDPDTGFTSIVSRFRVSADPSRADPDEAVLLELPQPFLNHNGGQLQFGPDGQLYVGFGDGGDRNDPGCRAQRGDTWHGKLLRLAVDPTAEAPPYYAVPPDNPYASPGDGVLDEIWQSGLRNPWRFSFDRATGELWIGDVGQDALEEVDRAPAPPAGGALNFGWKLMEANACANPDAASCPASVPGCGAAAYTPPLAQLSHAGGDRSITGGYVYRGARTPGFVGTYVFGDFGSGRLYALRERAPGEVQRSPLLAGGPGWASLGEDAAGELYALDLAGDAVYRLNLTAAVTAADRRCVAALDAALAKLARARARQLRACLRRAAAGTTPAGAEACVAAEDPRVTSARKRAEAAAARRCSLAPPIGPRSFEEVAAAALDAGLPALRALLGADLDAALALREAAPAAARCQAQAAAGLAGCQATRLRAFARCLERGLRAAALTGPADVAACLDEASPSLATACGAARLGPAACARAGVDLAAHFPGCGAPADVPALGACAADAERCQTCLALRAAARLEGALDCDAFDDGAPDASCPAP